MQEGKVYCEKGESEPSAGLAFALAWGLACWSIIIFVVFFFVHPY